MLKEMTWQKACGMLLSGCLLASPIQSYALSTKTSVSDTMTNITDHYVTSSGIYIGDYSDLRISSNGISMIKSFEGCRLYAYKADSSETYYTIGYGHYGSDVASNATISQQEAEELFLYDLTRYEGYVDTFLNTYGININQNQYDALVSFTYNLGNVWNYDSFTLKTILINGQQNYTDEEIEEAFAEWCKVGGSVHAGVLNRRYKEAALFLDGREIVDECYCSYDYAGTYMCTADILNIRAGHGTEFDKLGRIPYGAYVTVTAGDGKWAHIIYDGIEGYACMDYLEWIGY